MIQKFNTQQNVNMKINKLENIIVERRVEIEKCRKEI